MEEWEEGICAAPAESRASGASSYSIGHLGGALSNRCRAGETKTSIVTDKDCIRRRAQGRAEQDVCADPAFISRGERPTRVRTTMVIALPPAAQLQRRACSTTERHSPRARRSCNRLAREVGKSAGATTFRFRLSGCPSGTAQRGARRWQEMKCIAREREPQKPRNGPQTAETTEQRTDSSEHRTRWHDVDSPHPRATSAGSAAGPAISGSRTPGARRDIQTLCFAHAEEPAGQRTTGRRPTPLHKGPRRTRSKRLKLSKRGRTTRPRGRTGGTTSTPGMRAAARDGRQGRTRRSAGEREGRMPRGRRRGVRDVMHGRAICARPPQSSAWCSDPLREAWAGRLSLALPPVPGAQVHLMGGGARAGTLVRMAGRAGLEGGAEAGRT